MTTSSKTTGATAKIRVHYHANGSIHARGQVIGDTLVGYWEWFRKDGTKLRSGHFDNGKQTGEWITYDRKGAVYKITKFKTKKSR